MESESTERQNSGRNLSHLKETRDLPTDHKSVRAFMTFVLSLFSSVVFACLILKKAKPSSDFPVDTFFMQKKYETGFSSILNVLFVEKTQSNFLYFPFYNFKSYKKSQTTRSSMFFFAKACTVPSCAFSQSFFAFSPA